MAKRRSAWLVAAAGLIAISVNTPTCAATAAQDDTGGAARFTMVERASALSFDGVTRKVALLIGNENYDDQIDAANTQRSNWAKLSTPCSDVQELAIRLSEIGWKKTEIFVLCDQSGTELNLALDRFVGSAPSQLSDDRLMVLYYAGHGAQVDRKNYLFGVNSRPDWIKKADEFIDLRISGVKNRTLFPSEEALDLYAQLNKLGDRVNFPMLVFVDACRNNPMLDKLREAFEERVAQGGRDAEKFLPTTGRPGALTGLPSGVEMVFATIDGLSINDDDGSGQSRLMRAMRQEVKPGIVIPAVIRRLEQKLIEGNDWSATSQKLDRDGHIFMPDDGSLCFFGCSVPGSAEASSEGTRHAEADVVRDLFTRAMLDRTAAPYFRLASAQETASAPNTTQPVADSTSTPAPATIAAATTPPLNRRLFRYPPAPGYKDVALDVFWCDGGPQSSQRLAQANRLASRMDTALRSGSGVFGRSKVTRIRVRSLSAEGNSRPGYQRNADVIVAEGPGSSDELRIAMDLVRAPRSNLRIERTRPKNDGYMSIFLCRGAYQYARATEVYVHVARQKDLPLASTVIALLNDKFPMLDVKQRAQVMEDDPNFPIQRYPRASDVRYFRDAKAAVARQVASQLSNLSGANVRPFQPLQFGTPAHIEVWIGSNASLVTWKRALQ